MYFWKRSLVGLVHWFSFLGVLGAHYFSGENWFATGVAGIVLMLFSVSVGGYLDSKTSHGQEPAIFALLVVLIPGFYGASVWFGWGMVGYLGGWLAVIMVGVWFANLSRRRAENKE